jgi:alkylated DNA repair dioxygenase AlkB
MSLPEGLVYREAFVSKDEEAGVLTVLEALEFHTLTMRGQTAKRTVRHFGLRYDYEAGELAATDPLPEGLAFLRDRCAALMERAPEDLVQTLVSRYPAGAGIGWHRSSSLRRARPTCSAARRAGPGSTPSPPRRTCATP